VGDHLELVVGEHGDRLGLELAADLDAQVDALGGQRGADLVDAVGQLETSTCSTCGVATIVPVPAATAARAYRRLSSSVSGRRPRRAAGGSAGPRLSSDRMLAPVPVVAHVAPAVEPLQLLAPTVAAAALRAPRAHAGRPGAARARVARRVLLRRRACSASSAWPRSGTWRGALQRAHGRAPAARRLGALLVVLG
jgi:hypothetical protein